MSTNPRVLLKGTIFIIIIIIIIIIGIIGFIIKIILFSLQRNDGWVTTIVFSPDAVPRYAQD